MFMSRIFLAGTLGLLLTLASASRAADLTALESRWLQAGMPVLLAAKAEGLPLDIIVQPQPTPGETPIGLAYIDGRCKLVLSTRGNEEAEKLAASIPSDFKEPILEAVMAHEIGHCWRHHTGAWGTLPPGLEAGADLSALSAHDAEQLKAMWATRREEGFADAAGLAWTLEKRPQAYARVHAWLTASRAEQELPGGFRDTRAWLRLAADPAVFRAAPTYLERAHSVWVAGLTADF
jgi:hypothetical protein